MKRFSLRDSNGPGRSVMSMNICAPRTPHTFIGLSGAKHNNHTTIQTECMPSVNGQHLGKRGPSVQPFWESCRRSPGRLTRLITLMCSCRVYNRPCFRVRHMDSVVCKVCGSQSGSPAIRDPSIVYNRTHIACACLSNMRSFSTVFRFGHTFGLRATAPMQPHVARLIIKCSHIFSTATAHFKIIYIQRRRCEADARAYTQTTYILYIFRI